MIEINPKDVTALSSALRCIDNRASTIRRSTIPRRRLKSTRTTPGHLAVAVRHIDSRATTATPLLTSQRQPTLIHNMHGPWSVAAYPINRRSSLTRRSKTASAPSSSMQSACLLTAMAGSRRSVVVMIARRRCLRQDSATCVAVAKQYHFSGWNDRAFAACDRAIQIDPHDKPALLFRANLHVRSRDWEKAAADLTTPSNIPP